MSLSKKTCRRHSQWLNIKLSQVFIIESMLKTFINAVSTIKRARYYKKTKPSFDHYDQNQCLHKCSTVH